MKQISLLHIFMLSLLAMPTYASNTEEQIPIDVNSSETDTYYSDETSEIDSFEITRTFCTNMQNASLYDKVMLFPLDDIIERCKKDHNYSDDDMQILEQELRRFLYMCVQPESVAEKGMCSKDIDELWHTFILFTEEYHAFSELANGGKYLHHRPVRESERPSTPEGYEVARQKLAGFIKEYEATFNEEIHPLWLLDGVEQKEGNVV